MGSLHSSKRKRGKLLSCFFDDDVLCSFRESEKSGVMDRCFGCREYKRFMEEMEEEDVRIMEEIDREREALEREAELERMRENGFRFMIRSEKSEKEEGFK